MPRSYRRLFIAISLVALCVSVMSVSLRLSLAADSKTPATRPASLMMPPTTKPGTRPTQWSLARADPLQTHTLEAVDFSKAYPQFRHAEFTKSGFNAIGLPIKFTSADEGGDAAFATTLAFLLSDDLDYAAANYGTRHAIFVFKADPKQAELLSKSYDEKLIQQHVKNWNGTHAIGGSIEHVKGGYTGTLQIFDDQGKVVHEKKWADPVDEFAITGRFSAEALRYFGEPPNEALTKHLFRQRCAKVESLVAWGRASAPDLPREDALPLYEQILDDDPGFAEGRQYWANQRYFATDRDRQAYEREKGRSLKSAVTLSALVDFQPRQCPDEKLAALYPQWLQEAAAFCGENHPDLLARRIVDMTRSGIADEKLLQAALDVAGKLPNSRALLLSLGDWYSSRALSQEEKPSRHTDPQMAISIFAALLQCRALPPGNHHHEWQAIGAMCEYAGRFDQAIPAFANASRDASGRLDQIEDAYAAAFCMMQCGQFEDAQKFFGLLRKSNDVPRSTALRSAEHAAFCATLRNDSDGLDDIIAQVRGYDERYDVYFTRFKWALQGLPITEAETPLPSYQPLMHAIGTMQHLHDLLVLSEGANGQAKYVNWVRNMLKNEPLNRTLMIEWEDYLRVGHIHPGLASEGSDFYDTLDWLWSHDPWARAAVKRWRDNGGKPRVRTMQAAVDSLTKRFASDPIPAPWIAAAVIHDAVRDGRFEDARKLLQIYENLPSPTPRGVSAQAFISVLRRAIDDAAIRQL